ncbi:hypothetical protein [Amycolatopsis albispora]|uniref:Uncharacterized protein n=1 Tax=Amycolatopsis albispora TaxID=1804986 RepID=A0A344LCU4_9PSEU|nr:hypothetical protein [Amycolatopsis albispora]AXB45868.1 hypothetical protein A4R43_28110 [Amycolatopsis albispora]
MTESRPALVVHLATGGEPLVFALEPETDLVEFQKRLRLQLEHGSVDAVKTKEGTTVFVHYGKVAAAYVEDLQRKGKVFGLH